MSMKSRQFLHSDGRTFSLNRIAVHGCSRSHCIQSGLGFLLAICLAFHPARMQALRPHPSPPRSYDIQPPVRIPVAPLGFLPPGELPEFSHYSLVNLRFIDANHLLFVFNTAALLHRDEDCSKTDAERLVRAVVLEIPSGRVEKQNEWKLYDFSDFLWPLRNGRFLLRRCSQLEQVDASLVPRPFVNFAGTLETIIFSPDRSVVLVEEKPEPSPPKAQPAPAAAADAPPQMLNLDFIRVDPIGIIGRVRAQVPLDIPVLAQGFLETLGAPHDRWDVTLRSFDGSRRQVAQIHSTCAPRLTTLANTVFVADMCLNYKQIAYQAFNLQGALLWQKLVAPDRYSPRFLLTQDGAHFAIESLHATRPLTSLDSLDNQSIDAQIVDIYDTLSGALIASIPASPVYTAGTNVDFSPDGTRVAVLQDGAIVIYTLNQLANQQRSASR